MSTPRSIGNLSLTALLNEAAPDVRTRENRRYTFSRGDTVNTFTVLDPLGAGASGEVYAVYDPQLRHNLALKLLPAASPEKQDTVLREARLLADLRHPNIVRVLRAELWQDRPYFVMELLKPLPDSPTPDTVRDWLLALCSAVSELNSRGWIHRDIKAGNILYDDIHKQPVLADFGIASKENTASVGGTPGASAPEQFAGTADARSDVYALAMFAAKLLPDTTLRSAPWKNLLAEALSPLPALRPASAADFAGRIRAAFAPPPPLWRRIRLRHLLLALLLCFTGATTVAYYIRPPVNTDDLRRAAEKELLATRPLLLGEGNAKEHRVTKRVETVESIRVLLKPEQPTTLTLHIPKGSVLYVNKETLFTFWENKKPYLGIQTFYAHLIIEGGGTLNTYAVTHAFSYNTIEKDPWGDAETEQHSGGRISVELRDGSTLIERGGSHKNAQINGWFIGTAPKPRHRPTPEELKKARELILKLKGYTPAQPQQTK